MTILLLTFALKKNLTKKISGIEIKYFRKNIF